MKIYIVGNFKTRGINRGAHKLAWIPTLKKKTKFYGYCSDVLFVILYNIFLKKNYRYKKIKNCKNLNHVKKQCWYIENHKSSNFIRKLWKN